MTTEEAVTFHKLGRNLLAPTIVQAENEFVKREFLKHCTVHVAISSDIGLGDSVRPELYVERMGTFSRTPFVVTEEQLVKGITWQLTSNLVALPGVAVEVVYSVKKNDGSSLESPVNKYKVK